MQHVSQLLEQVRSHFLIHYRPAVSDFLATHSPAAPEVMFELERETPRAFRLYRGDMVSNTSEGPQVMEVTLDSFLSFESFATEVLPGLRLTVHPLAWHGIDFTFNASVSSAPVETWALRWLDVDDQHEQDADGLQGVIHSVTVSMAENELTEISVDFGSAPVLAFQELLQVLKATGVTEVEVMSSCLG